MIFRENRKFISLLTVLIKTIPAMQMNRACPTHHSMLYFTEVIEILLHLKYNAYSLEHLWRKLCHLTMMG